MKKRTIETKIGSKKLIFEADMNNQHDKQFAEEIKKVSKTKPSSIQEFFTRIVELQNSKKPRVIKDENSGSRKIR